MIWRARRRKDQPNWAERTGRLSTPPKGKKARIWVHTVSVGEFVAAKPVLKAIRKALPKHEILVSVTTSSGHKTASEAGAGLYDFLVYFPIDVPRFQLSAMQRVRPDVVVIFETELWLNFLWASKAIGARTMLVNGRVSDKRFPNSMRIKIYYKALFRHLDRCLAQSDTDADRFRALGAAKPEVAGNCKFDEAVEGLDVNPRAWATELGLDLRQSVIVIGSTRGETEERFVLDALQRVGFNRLQVVHAPRHLERADALCEEVKVRTGSVARRSLGEKGAYLVLDTYGELAKTYAIADIVIVGGGFEDLGGQNIIQPLAHGKPVIHGLHMQNFRDIAAMSLAAGASVGAVSPEALAKEIDSLIADTAKRERMGAVASELVARNLGASDRIASAVAYEARLKAK